MRSSARRRFSEREDHLRLAVDSVCSTVTMDAAAIVRGERGDIEKSALTTSTLYLSLVPAATSHVHVQPGQSSGDGA